ncbi:MAG: citryl-CoA lyase [Anaerolineales bacterium]
MSEETWKTGITNVQPNEIRLRGYRVDELMGRISFSQAIFLALTGELPDEKVGRLLDAILVASVDHGPGAPSALAARTSASTGAPANAAVAAGILSINRFHGAAISGCMQVVAEVVERTSDEHPVSEAAAEVVNEYMEEGRRLPGLGHRLHTEDPRTRRLFALAEEWKQSGLGIEAILALQIALAAEGKELPINVDGAIGAVLYDLGLPIELGNDFFIMARVPGLFAQVHEEITRERPMRRIHPTDFEYDGPENRSLGD